jgi:hypothetical protein
MYVRAYVDSAGQPLDASQTNYTLRLSPSQLPKCKYFWSITMYDGKDYFLFENPLKRYAVGDRSGHLKYDADGGLTLHFQHLAPSEELQSNWLPAPKGPFYLALRVYGNSQSPQELPGIEVQ